MVGNARGGAGPAPLFRARRGTTSVPMAAPLETTPSDTGTTLDVSTWAVGGRACVPRDVDWAGVLANPRKARRVSPSLGTLAI